MWAGLLERGIRGVSADRIKCETPRCLSEGESCLILLSLGARSTRGSMKRTSRWLQHP
jgi:hypothetical protein